MPASRNCAACWWPGPNRPIPSSQARHDDGARGNGGYRGRLGSDRAAGRPLVRAGELRFCTAVAAAGAANALRVIVVVAGAAALPFLLGGRLVPVVDWLRDILRALYSPL